jgi:GH25 family lysozyme M1 (1,4-beta-N-acetylmuramidase)
MGGQIRLPDVSNYQGLVDWAQVLVSGRAGGICKASEGMNFVDATFARNWKVLGDLNAVRGAYHFARPGSSLPAQQAIRFLGAVKTWKAGDILVLDLEAGDGNLSSWALGWLHEVQTQTGIVPWLYSYGPFIRAHLTDPALAAYPLWIAAYQTSPPTCPPPWKTYVLWQHTDKATVPGIRGGCDESVAALLPGPAPGQQPATNPAPRTQAVPIPVHDFEEQTVKQTMMVIGKLDGDGRGWSDWDPGLGRDPNIVGVILLGPSPPDDGYWLSQEKVQLSAQPRGGKVRVVVRGGTPGDTITCFVTVS